MNRCIFSKVAVFSLFLLLLSGCSSFQASPPDQSSLQPAVQPTAAVSSDTPTKTTQTEEAASGITATPWQMPTLAPMLPSAQASQKISSLFEITEACSVPCWWGMVPGETTFAQVLDVNEGLVQEFSPSQNGSSAPALRMIYQNDEIPFRSDTYYEFNNDVVQYIHIDSQRTSRSLH